MNNRPPAEKLSFARELPFTKWIRLAFLGSVTDDDGAKLVIARKYGVFLNIVNALAPILVAVLIFSGALVPAYDWITGFVAIWIVANVVILWRAPTETK